MNDNIPIIIWADVEKAPLGQPSKLLADLGGRPVLRQTLERVCRSQRSGRKIVFCRPEQAAQIQPILNGLPVELLDVAFDLPGWWPGIQSARKWAMDCWRGGLMGACAFDEDLLPHVAADLGRRFQVPAVLSINAHAAWVDPDVLDRQLDRYWENREGFKINFTQAPPGLAGLVLETDLLGQLLQGTKMAGAVIGYHPDRPQFDLISKACNLPLEPSVIQTGLRFTCDTQRSLALGRSLAAALDPQSAAVTAITETARQKVAELQAQAPREIELEIISGWPWEKGYRPAPDTPRGPLDPDLIIRRVAELAGTCDDLLIHIGGFGEPTRHPQFAQLVRGLREAGAWGIGLATTGLFDESLAETIVQLPLDLVNFLIDIPDRDLYEQITGLDGYDKVRKNVDLLISLMQARRRPVPLLIPEMIKTYGTMERMDEFFDGWMRKVGWAVIQGYSDYAGQIPDLAITSMAGPRRKPCRQIMDRMTVLADGRVVICNQDFNARVVAGSIRDQSLRELWQGPVLTALRASHRAGQFTPNPLCEKCRQWHRA